MMIVVCACVCALAGDSALELLQSCVSANNVGEGSVAPHIMFLDIRMPGKSGIDVMKACQSHGITLPFPVVAMTGNVDVDSVAVYK